MKLWCPDGGSDAAIERFTAGDDPQLDLRLVPYDCRASAAHAAMLERIGVLTPDERSALEAGLAEIERLHGEGAFVIRPEDEDVHTAIEGFLTERCGDAGKKIHTARSRNDQVLTAMRLYEREAIDAVLDGVGGFRERLGALAERHDGVPLPGYTHTQRAMPTTVSAWAGAYEALAEDDAIVLRAVRETVDRCPLGTAAGFGVPVLPIDRAFTAERLGFSSVLENPLAAQLGRGKIEASVVSACSQLLAGVNRLASDLILFASREFGFVELAEALTTGSSIMPQKRNPDVLEIVRGTHAVVAGEGYKLVAVTSNLMSGYHRDLQLTKAPLFRSLDATLDVLSVLPAILDGTTFVEARCRAAMSDDLYATERAYELVREGVPFREAYARVARIVRKK